MAKRSAVTRFFESPKLAIVLLLYLAGFSAVATFVPQGRLNSAKVVQWAATHSGLEPVVARLGLHSAYSSLWFVLPALLLLVSTVFCALARTRVALQRRRFVAALDDAKARAVALRGTRVASERQASLERAGEALQHAGFKSQRRSERAVVATSGMWALFASPVFHWLLVALLVVLIAGRVSRSSGLMGVPVGSSKPNVASSYGVIDSGRFYRWADPPLVIGVPAFDPDYTTGGVDRGATPTVRLETADGRVIKEQLVYPNHALTHGSLMIHASDYGLSPHISLLDAKGSQVATSGLLADLNASSVDGVDPAVTQLTDAAGNPSVELRVQLHPPHDSGGAPGGSLSKATATFEAVDLASGSLVASATLPQGRTLALPGGSAVRFDAVGYYARLSVVDDWSVTPLYVLFFAAIIAASIALLIGPRVAIAATDDDGALFVAVRFYRPSAIAEVDIADDVRTVLVDDRPGSGEEPTDAD